MSERTLSTARGFSLSVRMHDGVDELRLAGDLDSDCAWRIHRALGQMTNRVIVLDLSELDSIDGSGVAAIVGAKRDCDGAGRFLIVRSAHGMVRQVFRAYELDDLLIEEKAVDALTNVVLAAQPAGPSGKRCQQEPTRRASWVPRANGAKAGATAGVGTNTFRRRSRRGH